MRELFYKYESTVRFTSKVHAHSFLLRCRPADCSSQRVLSQSLTIFPASACSRAVDSWGSAIDYGFISRPHDVFAYISSGIVRLDGTNMCEDSPSPVLRTSTSLTCLTDQQHEELLSGCQGTGLDLAMDICRKVNHRLEYVSGSTDVMTGASDVVSQLKGVCQDFAHVMISLCRRKGIPARYVCGLVGGEGQTHAWVEVWDNGQWHPVDPTAGRMAEGAYIKLSHGRDALDCSPVRGVFQGSAMQTEETKVTVLEG